jgi:HEAT repeat protein
MKCQDEDKRMNLTFGRYPTRREIEEYYTRDDVLEYVCDASGVRKVILSFKDEPSIYSEGETPPIAVKNTDELKEYLLQRFFQYLPENTYPYDKPLGAYPSFHFITRGSGNEPWDFVMEADCHGWRKSFVDVRGAVEFLHNYDVPFIVKFSGHRSLHLIILREVFPKEFDGKPIDNVWKKLEGSMRTFFSNKALVKRAHGTGGILRLPYSLNENFGMVSLPIPYEELDTFRPWESFHHLVKVRKKLSDFIQECKDKSHKTTEFLYAILNDESLPSFTHKIWSFSITKKPHYIKDMDYKPIEKVEEIWQHLPLLNKPDDDIIQKYKAETPDIRWFIAESLICDERVYELLPESDEYAKCAIEDSIVLQANQSMSSFFDRIQKLGGRNLMREMRSVLEQLDPDLLEKELVKRCEISDESESLKLISWTSIVSSVFDDWELSEKINQKVTERFPDLLGEIDRKILATFRDLETFDEEKVREAQRVLIEAGDRGIDYIILLMSSNKFWVRQRLMEVILKLKNPIFIECLIDAMGDGNRKVRNIAMSALMDFGETAKPFVEEAANMDNPVLRASAIRVLSITEGKESIKIAIKGLESTNIKVKSAAIKSLRKMDDERAYEALRSALWDVSSDIGVSAAGALSNFGEKGIKVLKDAMIQAKEERAEHVLRRIAHGLAEIKDASGIDYLISALNDDSWFEWSTPWVIANLKNPHGNDALLDYLRVNLLEKKSQPSQKIRHTARVLGEMVDERVIPLVESAIAVQKDKKTLKDLIHLLGTRVTELKDKESVIVLIKFVQSNDYNISQRAGNELFGIDRHWLPEIEKALEKVEIDSKQDRLLRKIILRYAEH